MKKNNKIQDINEYRRSNKNNYKNRKGKKIKRKIQIIFSAIGLFGIIIANIYGYSIISKMKYDIHYLKKELREKQISLEELEADIGTNTSIQEIERKAKEELNMDYPEKDQIEYIEVDN